MHPDLRSFLRKLFVLLVAWPVILAWLGLNVRNKHRLPKRGPAIVYANHNSHLDILALLTLFPLEVVPRVRPVAAADYFMKNRLLAWFTLNFVGILPVQRSGNARENDPLTGCYEALAKGEILVIFPEGSRGEPEVMAEFKSGIWFLGKRFPNIRIVPAFMYGLGKTMPKGTFLPVPFFCDVFVGHSIDWNEDKAAFMKDLRDEMERLRAKSVRLQIEADQWGSR